MNTELSTAACVFVFNVIYGLRECNLIVFFFGYHWNVLICFLSGDRGKVVCWLVQGVSEDVSWWKLRIFQLFFLSVQMFNDHDIKLII